MSGTTYTQTVGQYTVSNYTAPTPTPVPTATPTLGPTATPTTTPTPRAYYIYSGTYAAPGFSATPSAGGAGGAGGAQTVSPTSGCAFLITTQDGSALTTGSTANANANGFPSFATAPNATFFANGALTSATITLGPSGGNGTFALDNGTSGTIVLTSRQALTFAAYRALAKQRGLGR